MPRFVLLLVLVLALFVALAFPWGAIDGVEVEAASIDTSPRPAGRPEPGVIPRRLLVTFPLPADVDRLREDHGAGYLLAQVEACEDRSVAQGRTLSQRSEMFERPQVARLGAVRRRDGVRHRYRISFDDWLPVRQGSTSSFVSAIDVGGGPCFSLDGGDYPVGKLWSDSIPLAPFLGSARPSPR